MKKRKIIAALNIGSANIICIIASLDFEGNYEILGVGHQISRGIKCGIITDFDKSEKSILKALNMAEKEAGCSIDKAYVTIASPKIYSQIINHSTAISNQEISQKDIEKLIFEALKNCCKKDFEVIDYFPLEYYIDGTSGIIDPRSMYGKNLGVRIHAISAQSTMMVNLANCLAKCHLNIEELLPSAFVSAFAVLRSEELNLGSTIIDIGAASTSIAIFADNKILYTITIPIGGMHITSDIAHAFSIDLAAAEKLKTLYGKTIFTQNDEDAIVNLEYMEKISESVGSEYEVNISVISDVIRPRVEEILEIAKVKIETSGLGHFASKRIILTGGSSQLSGIKELASLIFKRNVRIGNILPIKGLKEEHLSPSFASSVGALLFASNELNKNQVSFKESRALNVIKKIFNFVN